MDGGGADRMGGPRGRPSFPYTSKLPVFLFKIRDASCHYHF